VQLKHITAPPDPGGVICWAITPGTVTKTVQFSRKVSASIFRAKETAARGIKFNLVHFPWHFLIHNRLFPTNCRIGFNALS